MSKRPRLLDLFCGAGGCSVGYHRAGFDIVGVDNRPMPRYPFEFHQADALEFVAAHGHEFDAIHASPPCQAFSRAKNIQNARGDAPDLIAATRAALEATGKPWVIENVIGAPLIFPIMLCGTQFGLRLRRHRLFESSFMMLSPSNPCRHREGDLTIFGNAVELCRSGAVVYKPGDGSNRKRRRTSVDRGREAMGIDWMNRSELSQAIPPAYTEFIGRQLIDQLDGTA